MEYLTAAPSTKAAVLILSVTRASTLENGQDQKPIYNATPFHARPGNKLLPLNMPNTHQNIPTPDPFLAMLTGISTAVQERSLCHSNNLVGPISGLLRG